MNAFRLLAGLCALVLSAVPATAGTVITGVAALREWNLIVLGNASSSSTVAGRSFIAGTLSGGGSGWLQGNAVPLSTLGTPGLTVVGNVDGSHKSIVGGANVGGTVNSGFNLNGANQTVRAGGDVKNTNVNGNTVIKNLNATNPAFGQGLADQSSALVLSMSELSKGYAKLAATNAVVFANGGATFNAAPNAAGLAVFSLTGAQFNALNQINFNLNGADTVVVNVSGGAISNMANFNGNSALASRIIWNFADAQSFNNQRQMWGTVLAPQAAAQLLSAIDGSVVVKSMNQNAQIHLGVYSGNFDPLGVRAVPEPQTWALLLMGFGMLGGGLRRANRTRFAAPRLAALAA